LDTGAGGKSINQNFVWNQKIKKKELKYPIEVFDVDGTPNKRGTITKHTQLDLTINGQTRTQNLLVTGLGKQKVILGYPWFKQTNPDINWKECTLTWQTEQYKRKPTPKSTIKNKIDPENWKNRTVNLIEELDDEQIGNAVLLSYIEEAKVWINAKTGIAMELAIKENEKKAVDTRRSSQFPGCFWWQQGKPIPWIKRVGPQDWYEKRIWAKIFEELQSDTGGTKRTRQIFGWKLGKRIYLTVSVTPSVTFLLCQEEGWKTSTMSRLSVLEWLDNQKCISSTPNFRNHGQAKRSKILVEIWCMMGYNNIWIWSGDEWKATFKMNRGLYEPTVMFFGMCNSLATFQAMMDKIFKKKIEENLIIVYMDDILAFSKTIDSLEKIEWIILEKAWEYDLYFKAKKCKFRKPEIKYLGLVVEEGKLAMDPTKLKGILHWPAPETVKEVWSFLGFGNFYCHFVKGFSHLAHHLDIYWKRTRNLSGQKNAKNLLIN
jgi:hypothetical protein